MSSLIVLANHLTAFHRKADQFNIGHIVDGAGGPRHNIGLLAYVQAADFIFQTEQLRGVDGAGSQYVPVMT